MSCQQEKKRNEEREPKANDILRIEDMHKMSGDYSGTGCNPIL